MCLCDHESPVGNPLHNSKFKFRACPYRPRRSSNLYKPKIIYCQTIEYSENDKFIFNFIMLCAVFLFLLRIIYLFALLICSKGIQFEILVPLPDNK